MVAGLTVDTAGNGPPLRLVQEVCFSVAPGQTVGLVGESGSGKTLTALALMGLLDPKALRISGAATLGGQPLLRAGAGAAAHRGAGLGMMFQEVSGALNPVLAVGTQLREVLARHSGLRGAPARAQSEALLVEVGLQANAARVMRAWPHQLSGGMQQRVQLALALAAKPSVLLADEPTTALDVTTQARVLALLADLQQRRGMAMVFISHDLGVVRRVAQRVLVMYAGRVVEAGSVEQMLTAPAHPYTRALVDCRIPPVGSPGVPHRLSVLPGQPASAATRPQGCAFHPRCTRAVAECRSAPPAWLGHPDAHGVACLRPLTQEFA